MNAGIVGIGAGVIAGSLATAGIAKLMHDNPETGDWVGGMAASYFGGVAVALTGAALLHTLGTNGKMLDRLLAGAHATRAQAAAVGLLGAGMGIAVAGFAGPTAGFFVRPSGS